MHARRTRVRSCAPARSSCACCGRTASRPRRAGAEPNDRATVIHLRDGAFDLLLTADAESNVTAGLDLPVVDALKVAHHGSDDPGLPDLLRRLRPRVAVISAGARNLYGHPTPGDLAQLRAAVPIVRRTDRDGTVRLRVHGGRMTVERGRLDSTAVASFKPAYLIHGDDHGRIGERRAALRALAERESGCNGVECFEGDAATPEAIARALDAMTFAIGRRFLVVDGAERWKDADVEAHLAPALHAIAPDTTVAFFGRDEGRMKVSPVLVKAVEQAGGVVAVERVLKSKDLPRWLQGEADRLGVALDRDGAQALVALVGERQQRLLRELEKLALELGPGARIGRDVVEDAAAHSSERQVWGLVDALVAGDGAGRDERLPHAVGAGRVRRAARRPARQPRARRAGDRPAPRGGGGPGADQAEPEDEPVGRRPADRRGPPLGHLPPRPCARDARRPRARLPRRQRAVGSHRGDPRDRADRRVARRVSGTTLPHDSGGRTMATATRIGTAGLQGWRRKVGDAVAEPVAQRTPMAPEHVRAAIGALFFVLSVLYIVKTVSAASRELSEG